MKIIYRAGLILIQIESPNRKFLQETILEQCELY
jgi:hypothetical protein